MKTLEQVQEALKIVKQQREHAEAKNYAPIALFRAGEEAALLWMLDRDAEAAAILGMSEEDFNKIKEHAARFKEMAGGELSR